MKEIKAVLFDMDGVLFDSEPLHAKAWEKVLCNEGLEIEADFLEKWVGKPDEDLAVFLCENNGLKKTDNELLIDKHAAYGKLIEQELKPCEGVWAGLTLLCELKVPVAVVTSTNRQQTFEMLLKHELLIKFSAIVTSNDVNAKKPDPEPYLSGAEQLGVKPENCVVIEDSDSGIQSGRKAGCLVLGVKSSFGCQNFSEAHHVMSSTDEAIKWVIEKRRSQSGAKDMELTLTKGIS